MFRKMSLSTKILLSVTFILTVICICITISVFQISKDKYLKTIQLSDLKQPLLDSTDMNGIVGDFSSLEATVKEATAKSENYITNFNPYFSTTKNIPTIFRYKAPDTLPASETISELIEDTLVFPDDNAAPITLLRDYSVYTEFSIVIKEVLKESLILMVILIIIGQLGVRIVIKKGLRPISNLCRDISEIDDTSLNTILPTPKSRDEIFELVESFNRMLARLNHSFETQKRFSSTAAHELKTPLAAIISNIEVLELDEKPDYDECMETLEIVKSNALRMENLISDLLSTYSDNILTNEKCDLRNICVEAGNICMVSDDKQVSFEISGELCVYGDKFLLERAISNIIGNAFRYNRKNGSVEVLLEENLLTVRDTGIGIPKGDLDKIYEPFYRVDVSRSRELGGSGLGLSIAKQIFDTHNAKLTITSEYGTGTEVTVAFNL